MPNISAKDAESDSHLDHGIVVYLTGLVTKKIVAELDRFVNRSPYTKTPLSLRVFCEYHLWLYPNKYRDNHRCLVGTGEEEA